MPTLSPPEAQAVEDGFAGAIVGVFIEVVGIVLVGMLLVGDGGVEIGVSNWDVRLDIKDVFSVKGNGVVFVSDGVVVIGVTNSDVRLEVKGVSSVEVDGVMVEFEKGNKMSKELEPVRKLFYEQLEEQCCCCIPLSSQEPFAECWPTRNCDSR